MSVDLEQTEEVIKTVAGFTPKQWAVIIFLIASCVGTAFWVENRYAKINEIDKEFSKNQQQIESAHFLALEMFSLLPEEQRRAIMEKMSLAQVNKDRK